MKLAIASTTLLFAMMAAQAAVLSTTSSTGVNLVKRAPTSDDEADVEQSDMAGQSSSDQAPQLPSQNMKRKSSTCYMWSLKWAKQIWTNVGWTGTVEHESMGTRHDNRALAARLADFLQVAYRQYQSTLWEYHRDRLVEVG
ncbi:hypothetical protein BASA81_017076 [Batrachochytrium salamandrivorans]|nr:hypothetical protein BASA81_017076 [Batrachochytrium salamandrivorans]